MSESPAKSIVECPGDGCPGCAGCRSSDTDTDNLQPPAKPMTSEAYRVEVEDGGCGTCGAGRRYQVVGPDDTGSSTTWDDLEPAEHEADLCNSAFELGRKATSEEVMEIIRERDRLELLAIELAVKRDLLEAAIRTHHDQRGDDRCWLDDIKLYEAIGIELPEGSEDDVVRLPPREEFLGNCARYWESRQTDCAKYQAVSILKEVQAERDRAITQRDALAGACSKADALLASLYIHPAMRNEATHVVEALRAALASLEVA